MTVIFGCGFCEDDQNRLYGHVTQIASDDERRMILLQCPRCGAFYENSAAGPDVTRRLDADEAKSLFPPSAYPCPCCGYLTSSSPGSDDICPICGWQDDLSQLRFANMAGGANAPSLVEAQRNFERAGASDPARLADGRIHVRPPLAERRDPHWRLLAAEDVETLRHGVDQGRSYPSDLTDLYYWRPTSPQKRGVT